MIKEFTCIRCGCVETVSGAADSVEALEILIRERGWILNLKSKGLTCEGCTAAELGPAVMDILRRRGGASEWIM